MLSDPIKLNGTLPEIDTEEMDKNLRHSNLHPPESYLPVHADFDVVESGNDHQRKLWNNMHVAKNDSFNNQVANELFSNDTVEWMEQRDKVNQSIIVLREIADSVGALIISDKLLELNSKLCDILHHHYGMGD